MRNETHKLHRVLATVFIGSILLSGCGGGMGGCNESKDTVLTVDDSVTTGTATGSSSDVGPQYQQPTLDNLRGIEQKFPANYPVKRYPNSRVVMADVRPHLEPGQHNIVLLKSSDQGPMISSYYRVELPKDGWKLTYQGENSAYTQLRYRKGDQEIEVRIMPDPQGRKHVQLVSGPYQPVQTFDDEVPGVNPPPAQ